MDSTIKEAMDISKLYPPPPPPNQGNAKMTFNLIYIALMRQTLGTNAAFFFIWHVLYVTLSICFFLARGRVRLHRLQLLNCLKSRLICCLRATSSKAHHTKGRWLPWQRKARWCEHFPEKWKITNHIQFWPICYFFPPMVTCKYLSNSSANQTRSIE